MDGTPLARRGSSTATTAAGALFICMVTALLGCTSPIDEVEPLPTTREGLEAAVEEDYRRLEERVIQPRPIDEEGQPIATDPEVMEIGTHLTALHEALDELDELDEESKETR